MQMGCIASGQQMRALLRSDELPCARELRSAIAGRASFSTKSAIDQARWGIAAMADDFGFLCP